MADDPAVEPQPVQLQPETAEEQESGRNDIESQVEDKKEDEGEGSEKSDLSPKEEEKSQIQSTRKRPDKTDVVTPTSERPARERKLVERYSISPAVRTPASKGVSIGKGRGTQLKDIPNVAFKLSKRKPDDNLQLLHTLLYGKKAKTHSMKKNIGQFSGYVWSENEEKQRSKMKEKLDKCVKEKLVFLCDVLDIPINKALIKKEELSTKLLEFLESPHATTDALLAEKEQKGQKRKKKSATSKASGSGEVASETPPKKQKRTPKGGEKRKRSSTKDDSKGDEKVLGSDTEDDSNEDNEEDAGLGKEGDTEPQQDEDTPKAKEPEAKGNSSSKETVEGTESTAEENLKQEKKASPKKGGKPPSKSAKSPTNSGKKSSAKKACTDAEGASGSPSKVKESESKNKKKKKVEEKKEKENEESVPSKGKSSNKKQPKAAKDSATDEGLGKGKSGKKTKAGPSKEEMHAVVVDILKVVDFNTATLSDILKQLGAHFGVDLINRKAEVKEIITDVINNMTDEEDEGEEEDEKEDDASEAEE